MADAAGVDLDTDLPSTRFRDFDVGDFELRIRRGYARDLHRGHVGDITPDGEGVPLRSEPELAAAVAATRPTPPLAETDTWA